MAQNSESVNTTLLESIKNFMDDLSSVANSKNFTDFYTIVKRIDETKVKSYNKLINGFKVFFDDNKESLIKDDFDHLSIHSIAYRSDNGSFSFDFYTIFHETDENNQEVIKDHLNHIWSILNNENKSPEELYIDKIFKDLKEKFSPDMSREEQMTIAKNLFSDFQKQNLDISIVIKVACLKAREAVADKENNENIMALIDAVEDIQSTPLTWFNLCLLVGKVAPLFSNDENSPFSEMFSSMFSDNFLQPFETLSIESGENSPLNRFMFIANYDEDHEPQTDL
jgi:hypothetical protein